MEYDLQRWYVVQTISCEEEKVSTRLRSLGLSTIYMHHPEYHEWKALGPKRSRMVKVPKRPYMPSYIFADPTLDGTLRYDVINGLRNARLVSPPNQLPVPVPYRAMVMLQSRVDPSGALIPPAGGGLYKSGKIRPHAFAGNIGDKVRLGIGMGAWAGFVEAVKEIDESGQIIVELNVFGRATPLKVPAGECELLPKPQAG